MSNFIAYCTSAGRFRASRHYAHSRCLTRLDAFAPLTFVLVALVVVLPSMLSFVLSYVTSASLLE